MLEREVVRRRVLAASLIAMGGLFSPVRASEIAKSHKLFAGTALANNPLAKKFEIVAPDLRISTTLLQTPAGGQRLTALRSPATLVTVWAEFCAPCLMEIPDLARLRERYHASGFNVVALHLGGTLPTASTKLASLNARTIPCWNDPHAKVVTQLATPSGTQDLTLPCNVLIDRRGRVRGRAFGAQTLTRVGTIGHSLTAREKQQLAHARSVWSLPPADQFAQALAGGLLDRI